MAAKKSTKNKGKKSTVKSNINKDKNMVIKSKVLLKKINLLDSNLLTINQLNKVKVISSTKKIQPNIQSTRTLRTKDERIVPAKFKNNPAFNKPKEASENKNSVVVIEKCVVPEIDYFVLISSDSSASEEDAGNSKIVPQSRILGNRKEKTVPEVDKGNILTVLKSTRTLRTKDKIIVPAKFKNSPVFNKTKEVPKDKNCVVVIEKCVAPVNDRENSKEKTVPQIEKPVSPIHKSKIIFSGTRSLRNRDERKVPLKFRNIEKEKEVRGTDNEKGTASNLKIKKIGINPKVVLNPIQKNVSPVKVNSHSLRNRDEMKVPLKFKSTDKSQEKPAPQKRAADQAITKTAAPKRHKFNLEKIISPVENNLSESTQKTVPVSPVSPVTTNSRSLRNRDEMKIPLKFKSIDKAQVKPAPQKRAAEQEIEKLQEITKPASPKRLQVDLEKITSPVKNILSKSTQKTVPVETDSNKIIKNCVVVLTKSPAKKAQKIQKRKSSVDYQPLEDSPNQSTLNDFFTETEKNFEIPKSPEPDRSKTLKMISSPKKPVYKNSVIVLNSSDSLESAEETEKDNVFDFLSNSQSNGSENDAATLKILQDLNKKGKITIKNRRKRKNLDGKPPVPKKRKIPTKIQKQSVPVSTSTPNHNKNLPSTSSKATTALHHPIIRPILTNNELIIEEDNHDYDDDEVFPIQNHPVILSIPNQNSESLFDAIASTSKINPIPNPIVQKLKGNLPAGHSTPLKRFDSSTSFNRNNSFLSPIPNKSIPWRVDNPLVPQVFNFHRTSDLTPSYSSDVIPYDPDLLKNHQEPEPEIVVNSSSTKNNNSDMENVNPNLSISKSPTKKPQRTPLKELSVRNLTSPKRKQPINLKRQTKYFGFDDWFDDEEEDENSMFGNQENVFESNNSTLKEKLRSLKKIKLTKPTRIDVRIVHDVFKSPAKQMDIREAIKDVPAVNKQLEFEELPEESDSIVVDLFSDPEPVPLNVTKSNVGNARRSYTRIPKPRRYNVDYDHNFDEVSDDEEEAQKKKPKKRNAGHNLAQVCLNFDSIFVTFFFNNFFFFHFSEKRIE